MKDIRVKPPDPANFAEQHQPTRSTSGARRCALVPVSRRLDYVCADNIRSPHLAQRRLDNWPNLPICRISLIGCACERFGRSRCTAGLHDRRCHTGKPTGDARRGRAGHRRVGGEGLPGQAHARSPRAGRLARRQPGGACQRPTGRVRRPRDRRNPDHARRLRLGAGDPAARFRCDRGDTESILRPLRHHGAARGASRSRPTSDLLRAEPDDVRHPITFATHGRPVPPGACRRDHRPGAGGPRPSDGDLDRRRQGERAPGRRVSRRLHLHDRHPVGA